MNVCIRLVLCLAVLAGGVMGSGKADSGYGTATYDFSGLIAAIRQGSTTDVQRYIEELGPEGANMMLDGASNRPLHFAAQRDDVNMVSFLIGLGANPSLPNGSGQLPMQNAPAGGAVANYLAMYQ
jgi:ankyrin repeat protein